MLKQKFRRGNLVHIIEGSCERYFEQGCDAVILGSYNDLYRGGDIFKYSVMLEDGRKVAWYEDDQLEFVEDGGEHLIEEIQENEIRKETKRILHKDHLDHLSDREIITLLRFIGFDYSVSNNYFGLWDEVYPLFKEIREADTPDELKEEYPDYDIDCVWEVFNM